MASALERATRAARGIMGTVMATMTFMIPVPRIETTARARMMRGKARKMSSTRWMRRSTLPPKNALLTPMMAPTAAPMAPSGRARENSSTTESQLRGVSTSGTSPTACATRAMISSPLAREPARSPEPDPRVDPRVGEVDEEVDHDEHGGHEHHEGLGQGVVAVGHRFHEEHAEAVEVEHLLGHD